MFPVCLFSLALLNFLPTHRNACVNSCGCPLFYKWGSEYLVWNMWVNAGGLDSQWDQQFWKPLNIFGVFTSKIHLLTVSFCVCVLGLLSLPPVVPAAPGWCVAERAAEQSSATTASRPGTPTRPVTRPASREHNPCTPTVTTRPATHRSRDPVSDWRTHTHTYEGLWGAAWYLFLHSNIHYYTVLYIHVKRV